MLGAEQVPLEFGVFCGFNIQECHGRVIVDSGASASMAGLPWLLAVQEELMEQYGEDMVEVDNSYQVDLTFANGEASRSVGRITVPALIGDEGGPLTFTGVDAPGPALLGMDHLEALGF
eukprot:9319242-Alexandrium_andersonii.AAC.1